MNISDAIMTRRSIRRFKQDPIPEEILKKIIAAASYAPSPKNSQPWRFVVIQSDEAKNRVIKAMKDGVERVIATAAMNGVQRPDAIRARDTIISMQQTPVTIFVLCSMMQEGVDDGVNWSLSATDLEVSYIQSIGAAIQNMLLTATEFGIGSLWNCDILYAYPELSSYIGAELPIIAAVSFGYTEQAPGMPKRKALDEFVNFL
jgi:F420 biosynthesis protein FbiB-like protein